MNMEMATRVRHLYRVGDSVKLKLGARDVVATVIEDRGLIGHGGEQVVRVATPADSTYHGEFEVSASLVSPAQGRARVG
jgi:hypothetical protein